MPSARLARIDVRAIPAHHSRRSLGLLSAISIARSMAGSAIFLISSIRSRERRVVAAVAPLEDDPLRLMVRPQRPNTAERSCLSQLAFLCDTLIRLRLIVDAIFELAVPLGQQPGYDVQAGRY